MKFILKCSLLKRVGTEIEIVVEDFLVQEEVFKAAWMCRVRQFSAAFNN